ncbi:12516_t:CDS:2 [Funneliformis geosporum]|nr:12516_t:CDS:2 [Funneliformis geosporum]
MTKKGNFQLSQNGKDHPKCKTFLFLIATSRMYTTLMVTYELEGQKVFATYATT